MEDIQNKEEIIGKVENFNKGTTFYNMTVILLDNAKLNIKLALDQKLLIGKIYQFIVTKVNKNENEQVLQLVGFNLIENVKSGEELEKIYKKFYTYAPCSLLEMQRAIESSVKMIKNEVIKEIVAFIYNSKKDFFFVHPAATKFHHSYVGGLSYHTYTMLKLIPGFLKSYEFLNSDLLTAGVILHDMAKIDEISGVDGEYTNNGLLLGHIVMGVTEIDRVAVLLNYQTKEEVMLLKHMVASHHGQLNFGSPKKPQIAEALLLWYLDSIDSKFAVLGEELKLISEGEWSQGNTVLDKVRFYKSKIKA